MDNESAESAPIASIQHRIIVINWIESESEIEKKAEAVEHSSSTTTLVETMAVTSWLTATAAATTSDSAPSIIETTRASSIASSSSNSTTIPTTTIRTETMRTIETMTEAAIEIALEAPTSRRPIDSTTTVLVLVLRRQHHILIILILILLTNTDSATMIHPATVSSHPRTAEATTEEAIHASTTIEGRHSNLRHSSKSLGLGHTRRRLRHCFHCMHPVTITNDAVMSVNLIIATLLTSSSRWRSTLVIEAFPEAVDSRTTDTSTSTTTTATATTVMSDATLENQNAITTMVPVMKQPPFLTIQQAEANQPTTIVAALRFRTGITAAEARLTLERRLADTTSQSSHMVSTHLIARETVTDLMKTTTTVTSIATTTSEEELASLGACLSATLLTTRASKTFGSCLSATARWSSWLWASTAARDRYATRPHLGSMMMMMKMMMLITANRVKAMHS